MELAVKAAGGVEDKKALRDKIYELEITTAFGKYGVEPLGSPNSGYQRRKVMSLMQWQKAEGKKLLPNQFVINGMVQEVVWPEEVATAKIDFLFPGFLK